MSELVLSNLDGMLGLLVIFFLIALSVYLWKKAKSFPISFLCFIFSILIGFMTFSYEIPTSPWIQIFNILLNIYILVNLIAK